MPRLQAPLINKRQRTARRLKFVTFVLQFFDARQDLLQLRRVLVQVDPQLLRFHHDIAAPRQVADQHRAPVAHARRVNVFVTLRHLLHRVDVRPPFVRKRRRTDPRLPRAVPQIGNLIHILRQFPQLPQRRRRHTTPPQLERDRRNHARQIAIARPLPVTIDRPLHLRRPRLHRRQRVGRAQPDVIVRVNPDGAGQLGPRRRCDPPRSPPARNPRWCRTAPPRPPRPPPPPATSPSRNPRYP